MAMIEDFDSWRAELLELGQIIQDEDESVPREETDRRFRRFVAMVDALTGHEGSRAVDTLFDAIQVEESYGAYHAIGHALARFPESEYLNGLVKALPRLIAQLPDQAGEHLVAIANGMDSPWEFQIALFNQAVQEAPTMARQQILSFIRQQELRGWLIHRIGILCPADPAGPGK
jgi:hypothetical protein